MIPWYKLGEFNDKGKWIRCSVCKNKARDRIREDTILTNYPLYYTKCKKETLINVKDVYSNCYQGIRCIDAESMSVVTRNFIGSAFSMKAYQKS